MTKKSKKRKSAKEYQNDIRWLMRDIARLENQISYMQTLADRVMQTFSDRLDRLVATEGKQNSDHIYQKYNGYEPLNIEIIKEN